MKVAIEPSGPVSFDVTVPGSKSLTNRALIGAALSRGPCLLRNASASDDSRLLSAALNRIGIRVEARAGEFRVRGVGAVPGRGGTFKMGNAGTALRFFTSFACLGEGRFIVDGDARMRERPIGGLVEALRRLGAEIRYRGREGYPPLEIRASGLEGGRTVVKGETSSQFVSSLLLAAPGAAGGVTVEVAGEPASKPYIDMTLDVMGDLGVVPRRRGHRWFRVPAGSRYSAAEYSVAGDGASANYWFAMAAVTGGRAVARGVGTRTRQGELRFTEVLERMGCRVKIGRDAIEVRGGSLRGVDVDMSDMPDSVQTLACAALFAKGPTRVRNVANLRVKETDRIAALRKELSKLGAKVEEKRDGFRVVPPDRVGRAEIETYRDHRMAMSFAVAATAAPGIVIRDPGVVTKSYPTFWSDLEAAGAKLRGIVSAPGGS